MDILTPTYNDRYQIRRQRRTIRSIYNHLKDPQRHISNQDLSDYAYHLSTIIDITTDPKTARLRERILLLVRRYIRYRTNRPPRIRYGSEIVSENQTVSRRRQNTGDRQ
jgi:hypothetical protein